MSNSWTGAATHLFIPLIVTNSEGWDPGPANLKEFVQRRVHFDPDPVTGLDRSISSYFASVSYGRAYLDARVSDPVTINAPATGTNLTLAAIEAQPNSHLYENVVVVLPDGRSSGMAAPGSIPFNPARTPNRTKGRVRVNLSETTGTWAMEIMHVITGIGDYYNGINHPGDFDVMAHNNATTHPSVYTKLRTGWIDVTTVPSHSGPRKSYALHAVGLPHPTSAGRVAGVKLQAPGSERYLIIESRMHSDRWETGFTANKAVPETKLAIYPGIPAEGVVIYEFAPETDPWPRNPENPTGPWPPLELRTVLAVGQTYQHFDASTPTATLDHRTGIGRDRTITVRSRIPGAFVVDVSTDASS